MQGAPRTGTRLGTAVLVLLIAAGCAACHDTGAQKRIVRAAVASNFAAPHQEIVSLFEAETGIRVETSLGATGLLHAQILNGAPFDVFVAADAEHPQRLEQSGDAVPGTRFTYAVGHLVLFAPGWDSVRAADAALRTPEVQYLAIAHPLTAPYGSAAQQVMTRWGIWDDLQDTIVRGENVGQAFQFVLSGAAEAGFVALSQVMRQPSTSYWIVPDSLHDRILQDAVLLQHGRDNPQALAFLEFLRSEQSVGIITGFGYSTR